MGAVAGLVVALLLVAACGGADRQSGGAADGRIAFVSNRDGNGEIYVMNADGSDQRRLTNSPAEDHEPAWSPDGRRIAFTRNCEIYVMNADGSEQRRLTDDSAASTSCSAAEPAWSPDGRRIAFSSDRMESADNEIFVMNADGTGQRRLTSGLLGGDVNPVWSPAGSKIAFDSNRRSRRGLRQLPWGVYVMNADGSNQRRLTGNSEFSASPSWSPDGKRIAFHTSHALVVSAPDGSGRRRLLNNVWGPSWSPDGKRIAFQGDSPGIYVINADGGDPKQLTSLGAGALSWSPGGKRIAFEGSDGDFTEIHAINADGSDAQQLTDTPRASAEPAWSPSRMRDRR